MYDYYLGGKDNYEADRKAAEASLEAAPELRAIARENRAFLRRAVRHLVESGVRQFLDIGAGLPTQRNVHEVAQEIAPRPASSMSTTTRSSWCTRGRCSRRTRWAGRRSCRPTSASPSASSPTTGSAR